MKIDHKNNLLDTDSVHIGSQMQNRDSTKEIHEMAIGDSSMSIKSIGKESKNTPRKIMEAHSAVLFDINEWEQDNDHNAANHSGDFGGNNDMTILSER